MKKLFFTLLALVMTVSAQAFEFDGINLNGKVSEISRQISLRGYVYDEALGCLKGNCQGTEIYLKLNTDDVKEKNRIGQLSVEVPMECGEALKTVVSTFNVIYHIESVSGDAYTYTVSSDGTKLVVTKGAKGVKLTYNTPYYKPAK